MKTKQLLHLACATGVIGVLLASAPALAQADQTKPKPAASDDGTSSENELLNPTSSTELAKDNEPEQGKARVEERDIVVTGNRATKLLSLPQSKTLITAEQRNLAGIVSARQLSDVTPGFNFTDDFGFNVRGVGRQTAQTLLGAENTVVQYVDGFINLVPFNIAENTLFGGNVQFIRGPAGTTYGRNAIAGAVNLLSRAPTPELTAQVQASVGRRGSYSVGANIAGPITDNLGFRVGFQESDNPTLQNNIGTAKGAGLATNNVYVEFQLEWRIGGFHIRNRATTFIFDNQPGYPTSGRYNSNLSNGNPAAVFGGLAPNPQYGYVGPVPKNPYEINVDIAGYDRLRSNFQNITNADLDLGFATLVFVGGYQQYLATGTADLDLTSRASYDAGTVAPGNFAPGTQVPTDYRSNYDNKNHFSSQELRLESKPNEKINWVVGFYHFSQKFNEHYYENIPGATDVILNPIVGTPGLVLTPNPLRATFEQRNIYHILSNAVFGNVTYDVAPQLRFDGGLRYTWDEKQAQTNFRYIFDYPPFFAGDFSPLIHSASPFRKDRGLSGHASLAWRPNPGNSIYLTYSRGYQASAFTLGEGLPGPDPTKPRNIADAEHLDVYELGGFATKGQFRFDGSIYYQNFFNMQIPISAHNVITTQSGPAFGPIFTQFTNAGRAEIYGAEAQLSWRPNEQSNITASYTYLHPTFKRFSGPIDITEPCNAAPLTAGTQCSNPGDAGYFAPTNPRYQTGQDLSGNEIPRTPHHKAAIYGYYGIDLGSAGHLYPGGSLTYQSGYTTSAFANPNFKTKGRTVAGFTLTYRTANDRLDLTATLSNAFRTIYSDSVLSNASGVTTRNQSFGPDRNYNLTARYRF